MRIGFRAYAQSESRRRSHIKQRWALVHVIRQNPERYTAFTLSNIYAGGVSVTPVLRVVSCGRGRCDAALRRVHEPDVPGVIGVHLSFRAVTAVAELPLVIRRGCMRYDTGCLVSWVLSATPVLLDEARMSVGHTIGQLLRNGSKGRVTKLLGTESDHCTVGRASGDVDG